MNTTERATLVADMARLVLLEHAAGRSVDPDRLDWAIGVAVQALAPKHTQPHPQEESHA